MNSFILAVILVLAPACNLRGQMLQAVVAGSMLPIASLGHGVGQGSGGATATATITDTTGATVLILSIGQLAANSCTVTMTDKVGGTTTANVWNKLTNHVTTGTQISNCIWYSYGKSGGAALDVGATHTFACSGGSRCSVVAAAYSGTLTGAVNPFDVENGAVNSSTNSLSTGSITPSQNCELVFSGGSFNSGTSYVSSTLALIDRADWVTGSLTGIADAAEVQTTATVRANTWSMTGTAFMALGIASFKAATTGC